MKILGCGTYNFVLKDGRQFELVIKQDETCDNPRHDTDYNVSYIYSSSDSIASDPVLERHKEFNNAPKKFLDSLIEHYLHKADTSSLSDKYQTLKTSPDVYIQKLYKYEHGGIAIAAGENNPYSDPWDSGQIGYVFVDKEKFLRVVRCSLDEDWKKCAEEEIQNEIETFQTYIDGGIYEYTLSQITPLPKEQHSTWVFPSTGDTWKMDSVRTEIGCCTNFWGNDFVENGLLEAVAEDLDIPDINWDEIEITEQI